jgi:hypothetical protein
MSRPGVPGSRPSFGANLGSITNHQSGILVPGAPAFRAFCEGWVMSLSSSPQLYSSRICRGAPGSRPSFGATSDQSSITNHQSGILVPGAPAFRAFCEGWGMSLSSSPQLYLSRICRVPQLRARPLALTSDQSSIKNHQSRILVPGAPAFRAVAKAGDVSLLNV